MESAATNVAAYAGGMMVGSREIPQAKMQKATEGAAEAVKPRLSIRNLVVENDSKQGM